VLRKAVGPVAFAVVSTYQFNLGPRGDDDDDDESDIDTHKILNTH
jgi:hypothetical protein